MFSIFFDSKYTFEGERPSEKTIFILRAHWFFLLANALVLLFLAFVPLMVYLPFHKQIADFGLRKLFLFLTNLYYFAWWNSLFYRLLMYLLNTWIVTDERVIFNKQEGYFRRSVAEFNISKIQDIQVSARGPIATFLNFGDLEAQTAGAQNKFLFKNIPNPLKVKDAIMQAQNNYSSGNSRIGDVV